MSHAGKISTVKTLHGCVQKLDSRIGELELELAKALAQFGEADPLVGRLREQLRRADAQLVRAVNLYDAELNR